MSAAEQRSDGPLASHPLCAGCSPAAGAPDTVYTVSGPASVRGRVRLHDRHQGWARIAHGGVVALTLDEAVGTLLTSMGLRAVTAQLDVSYLSPCPVGMWLDVEARVLEHEGRRREIEVVLRRHDAERPIATARATALEVADDHPAFTVPAG
ncbi:hypothetical protein ASD11_00760 [Aeromicrobium sp. Root495]|uniref:PaaI family thioesterase n=1 Tax=Aeromicrobium sp. Root495 TaxID=1736550 RepID=UPI0006F3E85B|nr:PaaI family thioesterase [Aeromicrobium sp. Root495]KQY58236.1 hypothetical protein ASD11_00760 [Aeromicrobium sp. Root495]